MKSFRRILCFVLALAALLALSLGARAAKVVISTQKLKIDGSDAPTTAYNIDGSNYFKLRDIAYLLKATDARFRVGFDARRNAIQITTGADYDSPDGSELIALGVPKKVVVSSQTLYIDGERVTGLSAYNIDGSNFFKLRDLGSALGFAVDYDEASKTMLILTSGAQPGGDWDPDIRFSTLDTKGVVWADDQFGNAALTMVNYWAYWCGPCVSEMPDLQRLADNYAGRGLQVIGLYDGADEAMNKAKLKELGITYTNLRYHEAFDPWMDTGYIPDTIFVDRNGKVLGEVYVGARDYDDWAAIIEEYLE